MAPSRSLTIPLSDTAATPGIAYLIRKEVVGVCNCLVSDGCLFPGFLFFSFLNGDHHHPELPSHSSSVSIDQPKFSLRILVKKYPLNMTNGPVGSVESSFGAPTFQLAQRSSYTLPLPQPL